MRILANYYVALGRIKEVKCYLKEIVMIELSSDDLRDILQARLDALDAMPRGQAASCEKIDSDIVVCQDAKGGETFNGEEIDVANTFSADARATREATLKVVFKTLGLDSKLIPLALEVLEKSPRQNVIWLSICECTGCSESMIRTQSPNFHEFIFDFISLKYHEPIMSASGFQSEKSLEDAIEEGDYLLCVEGGVCAIDGVFSTFGAAGHTGYDVLMQSAKNADAIYAIGSCSSYGGVQAAWPNPSQSEAIANVVGKEVVNIPGCPPSDINIIANLFYYALFKCPPSLNAHNRPRWAYDKCLHDLCKRKAKYESGDFVDSFTDENNKNGYCLFKVGCKGPYTYNNCPKVKFNAKTSWPVEAGHGCMACSEPNFWDDFGVYEEPMRNEYAYKDFSSLASDAPSIMLGAGGVSSETEAKNECSSTKGCAKGHKGSTKKPCIMIENVPLLDDAKLEATLGNDVLIDLTSKASRVLVLDENGKLANILEFETETNPKIVIDTIASNKTGRRLVENYEAKYGAIYSGALELGKELGALLEVGDDGKPDLVSGSKPSHDVLDLLDLTHALFKGSALKDKEEFINLAATYRFKHPSKFDFKLSGAAPKPIKLDASKSMRLPLIYILGGLDFEATAFGLLFSIFDALKEIANDAIARRGGQGSIYISMDEALFTPYVEALINRVFNR